MKRLYFALILLSLFFSTSAQYRSGLTLASNYSWYNEQKSWEEQSAGFGYGLGYRFSWLTKSKYEIAFGPAVNLHKTKSTISYISNNGVEFYQEDSEPSYYANMFATLGYGILPRTRVMGGYQFGYLWEQDASFANHIDHAALLGVSYDLGFACLQLSYQYTLNTEEYTVTSTQWDSNGTVVDEWVFEKERYKLRALQLSLFIPLNRKKGWDE
jgi:hypothetical protein